MTWVFNRQWRHREARNSTAARVTDVITRSGSFDWLQPEYAQRAIKLFQVVGDSPDAGGELNALPFFVTILNSSSSSSYLFISWTLNKNNIMNMNKEFNL